MPIPLHNLDDRTWADLVEEARAIIPVRAPSWSDHNPSDPGITLVEMFAYLAETLLYRINYVSADTRNAFLRLVNGPNVKLSGTMEAQIRDTLRNLNRIQRAVTVEDFEAIAIAAGAGRAKCIPERNLASGRPMAHMEPAAGDVTVVIWPPKETSASDELLDKVTVALEEARLLGSRIHVTYAHQIALWVSVALRLRADANAARVQADAIKALGSWFDPWVGGPGGSGWPFGRNVYISEIYELLSGVPGVVEVLPMTAPGTRKPAPEVQVDDRAAGRLRYNRLKELEAVELLANELPAFQPEKSMIAV